MYNWAVWWFRSIVIVRSIEDQFIPHSFGPEIVFMIFHSMNMIINCHSFHDQRYWWFRSIIIVRRIEDQFIAHSFGPGIMFMILNGMANIKFVLYSMINEIYESGASSLSEGLKINSSLNHLNLGVCLWYFMT